LNTLDIVIAAIILIPVLLGLKNGMLRSLFSLAGIIGGLILATSYNDRLTTHLSFLKLDDKLISLISFIAIIIFCYIISVYIARKISGINVVTRTFDRILGIGLGFLKGLVLASLFLILTTNTFHLFDKKAVDESRFYKSTINAAPEIYDFIMQIFPGAKDFYESLSHIILKN